MVTQQDDCPTMAADVLLGGRQLVATVTAQRPQGVPGETFRVHPHPGGTTVVSVDSLLAYQQHMLGPGTIVPVASYRELAVTGRQVSAGQCCYSLGRDGRARIMGLTPLGELVDGSQSQALGAGQISDRVSTQAHAVISDKFTDKTDRF